MSEEKKAEAAQEDYRDKVVMESEGVVEETAPEYVEDDDVENAIAEGYY